MVVNYASIMGRTSALAAASSALANRLCATAYRIAPKTITAMNNIVRSCSCITSKKTEGVINFATFYKRGGIRGGFIEEVSFSPKFNELEQQNIPYTYSS